MKPANAGKTYPAETYTREQINRLLEAMGRGYAGRRNRALTVVLWRCGLRVSEAIALELRDVNLEAGAVTIRHGKGNQRRVVGIDAPAGAVVADWTRKRRELGVGPGRPLFCVISRPRVGKPMYDSCVREMLKDAAERAGLAAEHVRVHPHGFRHTYASELAREGIPVHVIQRALGHKDLATTARYLDHLSPWEVVDALRARQWEPLTHPAAA